MNSHFELRAGNWIEYLGEQSPCDINTIYAISLISKPRDFVMYKPISISEEWLAKFGFDRYSNPNNTGSLIFRKGLFALVFANGTYTLFEPCYQTHIKYVHQLQNIFHALHGVELEMKQALIA